MPRLPASPASWPICSDCTFASTSFSAAVSRSSSISMSSGSTTSLSILSESTFMAPVTTICTAPPPDEPSARFSARSACAFTRRSCICASFAIMSRFMDIACYSWFSETIVAPWFSTAC